MINKDEVNRTFDLLCLVGQDTKLIKTGSGWWAGPCPFCGGKDRFVLKRNPGGWRWFCRNCGGDRYHTPIDYVMLREHCNFQDALTWLGNNTLIGDQDRWHPNVASINSPHPSQVWQARAGVFVENCESVLWSETGARALVYLKERGLKDDTLRRYRVGYNSAERFEPLEDWGLPDPEDGKWHTVWLPRGIVLPCFAGGALWYIKFRRPVNKKQELGGEQKYIKVKGSKPGLFGADNLQGAWVAVLTEGEFDCMLLDQEAGDLAGAATLGSATDRISRLDMGVWGHYILSVAYFLAAYDLDEEGEKGVRALEGFTDRVHPAHLPELPEVKDITDLWKAGGNLGDWVARTVEKLGLLSIRTKGEAVDWVACATQDIDPREA
jgi:DNA primase